MGVTDLEAVSEAAAQLQVGRELSVDVPGQLGRGGGPAARQPARPAGGPQAELEHAQRRVEQLRHVPRPHAGPVPAASHRSGSAGIYYFTSFTYFHITLFATFKFWLYRL